MSTFNANFSSSDGSSQLPRETPQRRNFFFTPTEPSTTPAAPPPSNIFGSSNFGTGASRKQSQKREGVSNAFTNAAPSLQPKPYLFQSSANTIRSSPGRYGYGTEGTDGQQYDDDSSELNQSQYEHTNRGISAPILLNQSSSSARNLTSISRRIQMQSSRSKLPRQGKSDVVPGLARDLTRRARPALLTESDPAIIDTEQTLRQLDEACQSAQNDVEQFIIVSGAAQELISVWKKSAQPSSASIEQGNIGPSPGESPFQKARFIATLLLELYHPSGQDLTQIVSSQHQEANPVDVYSKPMPQVLLEWINRYHTNSSALLATVMRKPPNPAASDFFWDAAHTLVLRGQFADAMRLLAEADFQYAVIEGSEGFKPAHFSGVQLQSVQAAVYEARQTINSCPGFQDNDWNLNGQEWDIYRKQVEDAIDHLTELADDRGSDAQTLYALPYSVYQHVLTIYNILLGDADVIIGLSQDWLEASMLLSIWWTGVGGQTAVEQWSFDVSRAQDPNAPPSARDLYLQRLKDSFLCVTDPAFDGSFRINPMSPVEVGVASILQGDVQSTVKILETLSLCVTAAVAEIGTWMGWLSLSTLTQGFDQEDLVVLNYGNGDDAVNKDNILVSYATGLFRHSPIRAGDGSSYAGWEIAFSVTSRLDEPERIQSTISTFLEDLPVTDPETAQKLIAVCTDLGLAEQSCQVSEAFGDHLVNTSSQYGMALLCYARAHSHNKVRQLTDLLNSYCLVQSLAYPPEHEMDEHLSRLVSNPRSALANINEIDSSAAEALQFYLVGYACLRKFYSARDEHLSQTKVSQSSMARPLLRKRTAAKALVAAINSAADSIYGGLYDTDRRSAISVDALLPLLGEATALLMRDDEGCVLTTDHMYAILAAVEDLQTVTESVYRASEECMEAALRNYHGSLPPSPRAMLKKSVSSGTNSNFSFSMMGSEMLTRSEESLGGKSIGSAVLVGSAPKTAERGWDWRAQFKDRTTCADDVLKAVRIGIARELSIATLTRNS